MPASRALIFFDISRGHRLTYLRHIVEHLEDIGSDVVILTTDEIAVDDRFVALVKGSATVEVDTFARPPGRIRPRDIADRANLHAVDKVIAFDGDRLLQQVALHGWRSSAELRVLQMRPGGQSETASMRLAGSLAKAVLRSTARTRPKVTILTLVSPWSKRGRWSVPDATEHDASREAITSVRRRLDLSPDVFWFGIVGAISSRKNPALVHDALLRAQSDASEPIGLVIAGKMDEEVRSWSDSVKHFSPIPIRINDDFMTDEDLDALIVALDCVVLAHSNEGPSGVLAKSRVAGTRVLAAGAQSLKRDCIGDNPTQLWASLAERDLAMAATRLTRTAPSAPLSSSSNVKEFCSALCGSLG